MRAGEYLRRGGKLVLTLGLLSLGGCLARLERNLDVLLSPDALANTLLLPSTLLAPLAQFLHRLAT